VTAKTNYSIINQINNSKICKIERALYKKEKKRQKYRIRQIFKFDQIYYKFNK